jgi:hypothetical protein
MRKLCLAIGLLVVGIISLSASAQQAPPSKPMRAFGDDQNWIVLVPLVYKIGDTDDSIFVPAGFVTDLASIPKQLWSSGLTPTGQYSRAAIIHDYLYWSQKCTRAQADRLLVIAMKESKVGAFDAAVIYEGVHVGGKSAWKQNASERRKKQIRVLPPDWREPEDPNMNWPAYRRLASDAGVVDRTPDDDRAYCHYGNSMDVPRSR